ncbi:toprim domain-containing protein, partial [Serratia proteamaculans]
MRLFIAEKPAVAKDIAAALGGGSHKGAYIDCGNDKISWLFGHVLQTVQPEVYNPAYKQWRKEDLPLKLYPPQYEISPDKVDHVNKVIELIKQADVIVHAGDPDDEGQLLVDELLIYSGND